MCWIEIEKQQEKGNKEHKNLLERNYKTQIFETKIWKYIKNKELKKTLK